MLMPASNAFEMVSSRQTAKAPDLFPVVASRLSFVSAGKRIIDEASFEMQDVPCTAIIGHNGAGKSVLLRLLHGLLRPTGGTISWGLKQIGEVRAAQAMVFQKPVLLKRSVAANLSFVLKRRGLRGDDLKSNTAHFLELADLVSAANRPAHVLSGGEAQRLAIARALATRPSVMLLDEPSASLDPKASAAVEQILRQTMADGVRVILVTQDIGQAERLADRTLVMHEGSVAEQGPTKQVLEHPQSGEAKAFLHHHL